MTLVERWNATVRKLNQFQDIYDETPEDEEITEDDCEYLEHHYESCVKPQLMKKKYYPLERDFMDRE